MALQSPSPVSTESWNCTAKNVEVMKGKTLNLISPLDATGGRCLWVHNEECCYDDKESGDCEYYKKSRCQKDDDFEVKIDSYKSLTCTLVIKSFNETATGNYQSISAITNVRLQKCLVELAAPTDGGLSLISWDIVSSLVSVAVVVVVVIIVVVIANVGGRC